MRATRSSVATVLLVALGTLGGAAAMAAEQTPEEILDSRGLKRSGVLFILESEAEFVPKVTKLLPDYRQLKGVYDKLATAMQIQAEYDVLDDQWTLVNEQLRNVQAEMDAHPPTSNNELKQSWQNLLEAERQLRFQYNELRREVNLRDKKLVSDSEKKQLERDFLKQRDDFLESSRELRALADTIKNNYNASVSGRDGEEVVRRVENLDESQGKSRPLTGFQESERLVDHCREVHVARVPQTQGQKEKFEKRAQRHGQGQGCNTRSEAAQQQREKSRWR